MKYDIEIQISPTSNLSNVDFNNIPFGKTFSDHMFIADYKDGQWTDLKIVPFGRFMMHPAALVLHYGQSIFEGMKASKNAKGEIHFLRPEKHLERFNQSAQRMVMPEVPKNIFMTAINELVNIDKDWIPSMKGSALYIRPYMIATDEFIGVQTSQTFKFIIFTGPVGPYYPKPVSLYADTKYIRAAEGGTGSAKCSGNYASSLLPATLAKRKGFDQVLWLDAKERKYVQEVGTMNIFFQIGKDILTPSVEKDTILKGITRDSAITILNDAGFTVTEREININEIVTAHKNGILNAVFGTGTAAVVAHVTSIQYEGYNMELPSNTETSPGQYVKNYIDNLRFGTVEDRFNWVVPLKSPQKINQEQTITELNK